jgi:hypothetical protein
MPFRQRTGSPGHLLFVSWGGKNGTHNQSLHFTVKVNLLKEEGLFITVVCLQNHGEDTRFISYRHERNITSQVDLSLDELLRR